MAPSAWGAMRLQPWRRAALLVLGASCSLLLGVSGLTFLQPLAQEKRLSSRPTGYQGTFAAGVVNEQAKLAFPAAAAAWRGGLAVCASLLFLSARQRRCSVFRRATSMKRTPKRNWKWFGDEEEPLCPGYLTGKNEWNGPMPPWLTKQTWGELPSWLKRRTPDYLMRRFDDDGKPLSYGTWNYRVPEAFDKLFEMNARGPPTNDPLVTIRCAMNLDQRKPNEQIRGNMSLPHGTGVVSKVAVWCSEEEEEEVKSFGASICGEELVQAINDKVLDFDVLLAKPSDIPAVAKLGKILGPVGLMPSQKAGTVVQDWATAIPQWAQGSQLEVRLRVDDVIHVRIGRLSFGKEKLLENAQAFFQWMTDNAPSGAKAPEKWYRKCRMVVFGFPSISIMYSSLPHLPEKDEEED